MVLLSVKRIKRKQAFSLVELAVSMGVVVVVLIPIMAGFASISRAQYLQQTKKKERPAQQNILRNIELMEENKIPIYDAVIKLRVVYPDFNFSDKKIDNTSNIVVMKKGFVFEQVIVPYLYKAKIIGESTT